MKTRTLLLCFPLLIAGCATATTTGKAGTRSARVYNATAQAIYTEVKVAMSTLTWKVTHSDIDAGLVIAKTPKTFATYGHVVKVRIADMGGGKTQVEATSSSKQAVDWSKGGRNINKRFDELDNKFGPGIKVLSEAEKAENAAAVADSLSKAEAPAKIQTYCESEWSGNPDMIATCLKSQLQLFEEQGQEHIDALGKKPAQQMRIARYPSIEASDYILVFKKTKMIGIEGEKTIEKPVIVAWAKDHVRIVSRRAGQEGPVYLPYNETIDEKISSSAEVLFP